MTSSPSASGSPASTDRLRFVGNATMLLHLGPFTLLTDPNFLRKGQRAYLGYGLVSKRLHDPAMSVDELPPLDAVVLSHLHGDHWDRVAERGLDKTVPLVTTPAAARTLGRRGFATDGLRTWQAHELRRGDQTLRITALPGRHGPRGVAALLPPVMGSLLDLYRGGERVLRMYVSGDTLDVPELRLIEERCPDIDVAVVHLGGTKLLGLVLVTMDGTQGADLVHRLDPTAVVPIHYEEYTVMRSPLEDFTNALRSRQVMSRLQLVDRGAEVRLVGRTG